MQPGTGRIDIDSPGHLLLTGDGWLRTARRLFHAAGRQDQQGEDRSYKRLQAVLTT